jgi:hypothetical protein
MAVGAEQGDQIGRILAYWAIVFLESFLKITKVGQSFGLLFSSDTNVLNNFLIKNGLGKISGDFFTNKSGHPGAEITQPVLFHSEKYQNTPLKK